MDPFDEQLKKIAQEEHFEFKESAWESMEEILEKQTKKIKIRFKKIGLLLLLCSAVAAIPTIYYVDKIESTLPLINIESNQKETESNNKSTLIKKSATSNSSNSESANNHFNAEKTKTLDSTNHEKIEHAQSFKTKNFNPLIESQSNDKTTKDSFSTKKRGEKTNLRTEQNENSNLTAKKIDTNQQNNREEFTEANLTQVEIIASKELITLRNPDLLALNQQYPNEVALYNPSSHRKWDVLLELNLRVQKMANTKINFNKNPLLYEIQAGVIYNSSISLRVGLNSYKLNFQSDNKQFNTNSQYWTTIFPNQINGTINLIEVPLVVGFHFPKINNGNKLKFGAETSLISSFLKYEDYSFSYNNADPTLTTDLQGKWVNKHFFNAYQVGLSVSYQALKFTEIGIKPYYTGSLKGIGLGKVINSNYGAKLFLQIKI